MKLHKLFFLSMTTILMFVSSISAAGDFDWIKDLNIQAQADPSGFRAALGARFRIGDAKTPIWCYDWEKCRDTQQIMLSSNTGQVRATVGEPLRRAWALSRDHRSSTH